MKRYASCSLGLALCLCAAAAYAVEAIDPSDLPVRFIGTGEAKALSIPESIQQDVKPFRLPFAVGTGEVSKDFMVGEWVVMFQATLKTVDKKVTQFQYGNTSSGALQFKAYEKGKDDVVGSGQAVYRQREIWSFTRDQRFSMKPVEIEGQPAAAAIYGSWMLISGNKVYAKVDGGDGSPILSTVSRDGNMLYVLDKMGIEQGLSQMVRSK